MVRFIYQSSQSLDIEDLSLNLHCDFVSLGKLLLQSFTLSFLIWKIGIVFLGINEFIYAESKHLALTKGS